MTTVEHSSGTLNGTGTLTVSGLLTWSGGIESGTGVTNANGGMTITGEPFLDTRNMNNAKTATWNGVQFLMQNASVFNNKSGATWNHENDASIVFNGGGTPTFNNAGTFEKTGGTNNSGGGIGGSIVFNNTGTVMAGSGILQVQDNGVCTGSYGGSWSVVSGATLQLGGPTSGTALSGPISGAGAVIFDLGTVTYTGTYNVTGGTTASGGATVNFTSPATLTNIGPLTVSGGTLNFSTGKAITTSSLTHSSGTLAGSDTVTVTGATTWSGGIESGTGVTNANGGMTITGEPFLDTRTMNNAKTATWNGVQFLMQNASVFNNKSGATWNHENDASIVFNGGGTPTFNNAGTFKKTGGTHNSGGEIGRSIVFNNTGTVMAGSGILQVQDNGVCTGSCGGSWSGVSGATLQLGGPTSGTALSGPISGAGAVIFDLGTVTYTGTYNVTGGTTASGGATVNFTSPATLTNIGPLTVSGGTLNFSTGKAITTSSLTHSSGTLAGSDTVTVTGATTWSGGIESGTGVTNANGGMTITGEPFLDTRTMNNAKTATWNGVQFLMQNASVFNNKSGATWNHENDASIVFNGGGTPTFNNAGTFEKTGGTNNSGGGIAGINFNNSGTVIAKSGLLQVGQFYTQTTGSTLLEGGNISTSGTSALTEKGGSLLGIGTITGGVENTGGTVSPSLPSLTTGTLAINGSGAGFYSQGSGGTLLLDIAGSGTGQFDVLSTTGPATLAGSAQLCLIRGFK